MIVIIEESVWAAGATDPLELLALFAVCADRRHMLLLSQMSRQSALSWMEAHLYQQGGVRRRVHQILEESRRRTPNASTNAARITVVPNSTNWEQARLKPAHAVRLLQRPLKLLVENSRNDRAFLRLMAEPADRRQLEDAERRGWIEFEMGGGIQELGHRVRMLSTAEASHDTAMIERARLWVMFDRDAHRDDRSRESDASREVRELAAQITTPWRLAAHQLDRRSIENYVPARTLRDWWCSQAETVDQKRTRHQLVEAFLTGEAKGGLSEKARQYFNMKRGLLGDVVDQRRRDDIRHNRTPLTDADLDQLFRGLNPTIRDQLAAGGGFANLSEAFSTPGAINEPDLFNEVHPNERRRMLGSLFSRM